MYVDDELEELLVEVNGELEVCIHSLKERECEWYMLAQGYNHPVFEFWWLQNIYSYLY